MSITEAQFQALILPFTLKEEGGYSKDRQDPGNWTGGKVGSGIFKGTKYGIAANSHPTLDIVNLTVAQAGDIYWAQYMPEWLRALDPALAMVVFDCGVNCGVGEAKKVLAAAIKAADLTEEIKTGSAANLSYHRSLKTWTRYGSVWGGRINRCQFQALKILAGETPSHPVPTATTPTPAAPKPKSLEAPEKPLEAPPVSPVQSQPKKTDEPVAPSGGFFARILSAIRANQKSVTA